MDDRTVRPLHDRILVRAAEAEDKSPGGIVLLDSFHHDSGKNTTWRGEIVAVGDDVREALSPGDRVIFTRRVDRNSWLGGEFDGSRLKVMGEEHILAVLE